MTVMGDRRVLTSGHFKPMPKIVVLCGSTRFYQQFQRANYEETMKGNIVLSVGFYLHASEKAHGETWGCTVPFSGITSGTNTSEKAHGETWGCTAEQKIALDELHKRKIDLADEVLVLNIGGYIGDSTRSEIEYAKSVRTPIRYQEPVGTEHLPRAATPVQRETEDN
jgi:hypothetical protein